MALSSAEPLGKGCHDRVKAQIVADDEAGKGIIRGRGGMREERLFHQNGSAEIGLGELPKGFGVLRRFGGDDGISRMDSRDRVGDGRVVAVAATADRRDAMAEFPEHACVPLPDRTEADDNGID